MKCECRDGCQREVNGSPSAVSEMIIAKAKEKGKGVKHVVIEHSGLVDKASGPAGAENILLAMDTLTTGREAIVIVS